MTIERPDETPVERLLDAGLVVMAIHPNHVKAYCRRTLTKAFVERMRSAPSETVGELETEERGLVVLGLVCVLEPLVAEICDLTAPIDGALRTHLDREIFASLFRDPRTVICSANLIAGLGDCRKHYPTKVPRPTDARMSPVAVESGKLLFATIRRACNRCVRSAASDLGYSTRH